MVIDYSKWDKLELSDDSDVEVHPNVDKKSFIRMKQRQIHQQRDEMKHNIKQLEISLEMNNDLIERIQKVIDSGESDLTDVDKVVAISERGVESKKHPESEINLDNAPTYNDMVKALMDKILEEQKGNTTSGVIVEKLKDHQEKLREIIAGQEKQYEDLLEERSRHILSEDIHTGFDSTIVNKIKAEESSSASAGTKKTTSATTTATTVETLNSPGSTSASASNQSDNQVDVDQLSPEAAQFLEIKKGDLQKYYSFLTHHPNLLNEKQKDAMLMEAFEQQLSGQTEKMKNTVYSAKLVEYCLTLGPDGMRMFFAKASASNSPVLDALQKDVDLVVNHIIERCKVIAQERQDQAQEPEEQIQLHAVDPDTEIVVRVPDQASDPEGYKIFESFSKELRDAIQTCKLDEINKVLANMSVPEAEQVVQQFDECGVLAVESKIYDATEWQQEKEQLQEQQ